MIIKNINLIIYEIYIYFKQQRSSLFYIFYL